MKTVATFMLPIVSLLISVVGLGVAWDANRVSRQTYSKEFDTDFSVQCRYVPGIQEYSLTSKARLLVPMECSVINLSNRTITIDKLVGSVVKLSNPNIESGIEITGVKANTGDDKAWPGLAESLNVPIGQGQKVVLSFDAGVGVVSNNIERDLTCVDAVAVSGLKKCRLSTVSAVTWERLTNYPVNAHGFVAARLVVLVADGTERAAVTCLDGSSCGYAPPALFE